MSFLLLLWFFDFRTKITTPIAHNTIIPRPIKIKRKLLLGLIGKGLGSMNVNFEACPLLKWSTGVFSLKNLRPSVNVVFSGQEL